MRHRNDLTILALSQFLTNSTELASQLIQKREVQAKEEERDASGKIPWMTILAAGATLTAAWTYLQSAEDELPQDAEITEGQEDSAEAPQDTDTLDDGRSILDKVVDWLQSIPESVGIGRKVVPGTSAVSSGTNLFVGTPSASVSSMPAGRSSYIEAARVAQISPEVLGAVTDLDARVKGSLLDAQGRFRLSRSVLSDLVRRYPSLQLDSQDPLKNSIAGALYLKGLDTSLGSTGDAAKIYLGHVLGVSNARRFMRMLMSSPDAIAADAFPGIAPALFYDGSGRPRTLAQVWETLTQRPVAKALSPSVPTSPRTQAPPIPEAAKVIGQSIPLEAPTAPMSYEPVLSAKAKAKAPSLNVRVDEAPSETTFETTQASPTSAPTKKTTYVKSNSGHLVSIQLQ